MLEFNMDISPHSWANTYTPDMAARSFPFCVTDIGWFDAGPQYFTRREGLNSRLAIITESGCGSITWKGQSTLLGPGSAVLINCSQYHEYVTHSEKKWRFYYIHFISMVCSGYETLLLERLTPVKLRYPELLYYHFARLHDETEVGIPAYALRSNFVSELLTEFVLSLANSNDINSQFGRHDINELARYIDNSCHLPLTIEDFTKMTNLSKYHLIRIFTRQIGIPPYRYLHLCRINHAQVLLKTTDLSIMEISEKVGYSDPAIFFRHFRYFNNSSPNAYRRENI